MNGQAKDLSDRNACFIYDTDERGSWIGGECSLIFAYVRVCSHIWKKMLRALRAATAGAPESPNCRLQIGECGLGIGQLGPPSLAHAPLGERIRLAVQTILRSQESQTPC